MIADANRLEIDQLRLVEPSAKHDLVQIEDITRLLTFARRHAWRIALGIAVGILAGWLFLANSTLIYESKSQLLIKNKNSLTVDRMDPSSPYYRNDATTHIAIVKSPWFLRRVVDEQKLGKLSSLAASADPIKMMSSSLTVTHEKEEDARDSEDIVLQCSFRGPVAAECPTVLKTIIEAYQRFLDESDRNANEDALKLVTQKAEKIQRDMNQLEAEYANFRKKSSVILKADRDDRYYESRLVDLEAKRSDLLVRRAEVEQRLTATKTAAASGADPNRALALVPDTFKRQTVEILSERQKTLEASLLPLLVQEKALLQNLGPGHRKVKDVRDSIALTRALLAPKQSLTQVEVAHDSQWQNPVRDYIVSLEQELRGIANSETVLAKELKHTRDEFREFADHEFAERQYTSGIARAEMYFEGLTKQLHGIDLSKDSGGYTTSVLAPADRALQVAPNVLLVIAISVFLGLAIGVGLAGYSEASRQSFRGISEIHERLCLPVVGQIPLLSLNKGRLGTNRLLDPALCTHHQPNSLEAETFRAVRTALFCSIRGQQLKVIQVASPNIGDGKSTLAANLALSMAQSGKEVLLIDADLRYPRIQQLFGTNGTSGLSSVIRDEVELNEAIHPSGVPGLSLLPAGPSTLNPADLLTSRRFQELIEAASERYDFVLIDTPALLAVTDPQVIATSADGVLLVIRPTKNVRPAAMRACEVLRMLNANLIGVVVNGSRRGEFEDYGDRYCAINKYTEQQRVWHQQSKEDEHRVTARTVNDETAVTC